MNKQNQLNKEVGMINEHKACTIRPVSIKVYVGGVALALITDRVLTASAYKHVKNMHKIFPKYPNIVWNKRLFY